ncbi:MAG TPA: adenosine deaminase [Candidatus Saccharimonadales bacterium]|nr:adenosine deaminase [Candidatus Saccharimonadales bacterium]
MPQAARPKPFPDFPMAELHAHLGASISPTVLWQLAHESGVKLPKKTFKEFKQYITLSPQRRLKLDTYFKQIYHPLLDPLSSGSHALEQATYHTMAGAYRENGITLMELRNNPMRHNQSGHYDLDHIIMAMLRGMERALLECSGLSAGLIFCLGRQFTLEQNAVIVDKAIKYRRRGVVGIDVADVQAPGFSFKDHAPMFEKARKAGLHITVHSGEVANANDMWQALEYIQPERIGHGILAAYDEPLMKELAKRGTVLEICPFSNVATKAVKDWDEMGHILRTFIKHKVRFCINTDWPELIEGCRLRHQFKFLLENGVLSERELRSANRTAFEASFIPKPGGLDAYL